MTNTISRTVSDEELNAMVYQESKGVPNATPGTSSALGPLQFLKATWRGEMKKYRPDIFKAYPNGALLALRTDWTASLEIGARFTEANRRAVGANCTLGDLYLAHFLGAGKARDFFRAPMGTNAVQLAPDAAQANKTVFYHKTATGKVNMASPKTTGEVRQWAADVMANAQRKGKNYVGLYWKGPFKIPASRMGLLNEDAANDSPIVKAEEPDDAENVVVRKGLAPKGDYRLYDNQLQLKHMNYNPGGVDGVWGGGTAGAIAAFFNDYAPDARAPLKWNDYDSNYAAIDETIDKAESERFIRPVTKERDEADPATIEKAAPEIVQGKQTFWGSVTAFGTAIGSTVYSGFNWLMGYKDQADQWGVMYYIDKVPTFVWLALGSAAIGFIVYKALKTVHGIEKPVSTGERM